MLSAKPCTQKLLRWLIMNLTSDFRNSKWRTQYGGHNISETQRFSWNFVLQGFWGRWLRIWHRIYIFRNGGSNTADMKFVKLYGFSTTPYSGVFGVADYEFQIVISEFRIADLIWQTSNFEICLDSSKFCAWMFLRSLFTIQTFYAQHNPEITTWTW